MRSCRPMSWCVWLLQTNRRRSVCSIYTANQTTTRQPLYSHYHRHQKLISTRHLVCTISQAVCPKAHTSNSICSTTLTFASRPLLLSLCPRRNKGGYGSSVPTDTPGTADSCGWAACQSPFMHSCIQRVLVWGLGRLSSVCFHLFPHFYAFALVPYRGRDFRSGVLSASSSRE